MIALGQIPGKRKLDDSPLLILAYDPSRHEPSEGRLLCIEGDGNLSWVKMDSVITTWTFGSELKVWMSEGLVDLVEEPEEEVESAEA